MKYNVAMKWVKALRSGKYKQTDSALQDRNGYCCLGVLCEIAPKSLIVLDDEYLSGGHLGDQPKVKTWSGIKSTMGSIEDTTLADLNDSGAKIYEPQSSFQAVTEKFNFNEIADIIQKHWKKL